MKHYLTPLFFLFFVTAVNAQNIVLNPDFAAYTTCPTGPGQMAYCNNWYSPNIATPDYFNACSSFMSVPSNVNGYQASPSMAYAGTYTYVQGTGAHEYIAANIPALIPGGQYKVTIRVSLSDSSTYGTDGLGIFFYKLAKPDTTNPGVISYTPQVDYTSYGPITNKINWVTLSTIFVADSAYTHMTIGNFKDDAHTTLVLDSSKIGTIWTPFAYYLYDSVALELISGTIVSSSNNVTNTVFPNPFSDFCTLYIGSHTDPYTLSVMNIQGASVYNIPDITSDEVRIQRNDLPPGFYYYHLRSRNGAIAAGQLVIQ
jgi:hypothetical protein